MTKLSRIGEIKAIKFYIDLLRSEKAALITEFS